MSIKWKVSEKIKQEQIFLGDNRIAHEFCLLFEDLMQLVHLLVAFAMFLFSQIYCRLHAMCVVLLILMK